jgi:ABC-type nitrate/sulfonate/bicarbonate transport system substrate-binding protein/signal transduction histidine kinase
MKFFNNLINILLLLSITNLYANGLEKISLQLQWKHQFEFAGFYAAKEKGFYKDAGLDVEFIEFGENTDIVAEVLSGNANYGVTYSSVIADYYNGKPLVLLANFFKQSPLVLVTQEEIKTLLDLKNKKIMGVSKNINHLSLLAMLDKAGVKHSDITEVPTNFSMNDFIEKKVDAVSIFTTNELYLLTKKNIKFNLFDPLSYGAKYYDENLFTTKQEVLNHPQRAKKFRDASIKGWAYALEHQKEMVDIILKKYNTQNKSKESLLFEAKHTYQIMLPDIHNVGSIDINLIKTIADSFAQSGFIKNFKSRDIESFIFDFENYQLDLTQKELIYLKNKKEIKICVDPSWMPFSALENDIYVGVDADFMKIFENKLGIPIRVHKTDSWNESMKAVKAKKCDLLSMAVETPERKKYLNFTVPYFYFSNVIVTKKSKRSVVDISQLKNEKIAIIRGYAEAEFIKNEYPSLEIVGVDSMKEGLDKVKNSEIYGFIENAFTVDYYFQNNDDSEFKIGSYFDEKSYLRLGVRDDDLVLHTILQKVLESVTYGEKHSIEDKWFGLQYKTKFDYTLFYRLSIALIIVAIILFLRSKKSKILNKELQEKMEIELQKFRDKDKMLFHQNKLAAMGEMLENIAHQWRQPLSQINSSVLLIDDILNEKNFKNIDVEERLLEIESLTKYLSNTINDFKDFFSHDKIKNTFLLREMIEKSIYIVKGSLKENNIEVTVDVEEDYRYYGYESELQQVVLVLLNNAKEALVNRSVKTPNINIYIELEEEYYIIKICDNAGGIIKNIREKIFEPYFTTKHKSKGTGLGLYMSKKIIEESMDGELNVNNYKLGVCFEIKLKVVNG